MFQAFEFVAAEVFLCPDMQIYLDLHAVQSDRYCPMGYLIPVVMPKLTIRQVILIGFLASAATEIIQLLLQMGWCETDDVIHNTLGTAIGAWVWHLQSKRLNKLKSIKLPND